MQVLSKIEQAGLAITDYGLELLAMVADRRIDPEEIERLASVARDLLAEANNVEDVALDIQAATQVLRLGRANAPDRRLKARDADLRAAMSGHREAPNTGDAFGAVEQVA